MFGSFCTFFIILVQEEEVVRSTSSYLFLLIHFMQSKLISKITNAEMITMHLYFVLKNLERLFNQHRQLGTHEKLKTTHEDRFFFCLFFVFPTSVGTICKSFSCLCGPLSTQMTPAVIIGTFGNVNHYDLI